MNPGLSLTDALATALATIPELGARIYRGTVGRALDDGTITPFAAVHAPSETGSFSRSRIVLIDRTSIIEIILPDGLDIETRIETMRRSIMQAIAGGRLILGQTSIEKLDFSIDIIYPEMGSDLALIKFTLNTTYPDNLTT